MSEPKLTFSWKKDRDHDLDLKEFASRVLKQAKNNLLADGYLIPLAFLITDQEIHCYGLSFQGHEQKRIIYDELIALARAENAVAIVTVNDAYTKQHGSQAELKKYVEGYYPGRLQEEESPECIFLAITGPGLRNRTYSIAYARVEGELCFGEIDEECGGEVGLLEGWSETDTEKK